MPLITRLPTRLCVPAGRRRFPEELFRATTPTAVAPLAPGAAPLSVEFKGCPPCIYVAGLVTYSHRARTGVSPPKNVYNPYLRHADGHYNTLRVRVHTTLLSRECNGKTVITIFERLTGLYGAPYKNGRFVVKSGGKNHIRNNKTRMHRYVIMRSLRRFIATNIYEVGES